ncbi:hypothetical protein C943_00282 [Mariniradius saccharolyticus AK6]|uniref:Uncharacterized protein n=1 Tax=Mariniradius saccharolyticus AK6 TaxID=1239962 RepID=M7X6E3_9BACT|nr:hypothetical protein C943_00282 [Mariniradius saccharolyticus AK6]
MNFSQRKKFFEQIRPPANKNRIKEYNSDATPNQPSNGKNA